MGISFFFTSPSFALSGVDIAAANEIRQLRKMGADARFVLTDPGRTQAMPLEPDFSVPIQPLELGRGSSARLKRFAAFLESRAPCVFVPGYDFALSAACPALSPRVAVFGVVHSDEPVHYNHLRRYGYFWDRIIAVSPLIAKKAAQILPGERARIITIPSGVSVPTKPCLSGNSHGPLKIVYAGRLIQYQKRVLDLAKIAASLDEAGIDFSLTIVGTGPDEDALKHLTQALVRKGRIIFVGALPNRDVLERLDKAHVLILTSEFEGTPVILLEAMAHGCVPVVSDIKSGIPDIVTSGKTGLMAPVGDIGAFVNHLAMLAKNRPLLNSLAINAHAFMAQSHFRIEAVAQAYLEQAYDAFEAAAKGLWKRPVQGGDASARQGVSGLARKISGRLLGIKS
ncbi:MAG: glycosyltransferase family 4 protein [Desulfatibacillaceae bacterium]|nr:glycosyltransferase family 4 protein [Desulfatibacillaceae bacterium]